MIIKRVSEAHIKRVAKNFPCIVITGPRRSGKTYLLKKVVPKANYYLLEDPDLIFRIKSDPRGWLDGLSFPVILDEIQNVPELLPYIRTRIDQSTLKSKKCRWYLTGSQSFSLMNGVTESMSGRAAIFELLPFSISETKKWNLLTGFYPEVWLKPKILREWFQSYLLTYIERDVRHQKNISDLSTFRRFITLLATRNGQILNRSDLAAPLGITVPTINSWLSILEISGLILLIPPYFENFGKRLTKSPKIYWVDTGLLCHLLGIESHAELERSPFLGPIFESLVASEIIKRQIFKGKSRELYFFRDEHGLEVDFLVRQSDTISLIEVKWSKTLTPSMTTSLQSLGNSIIKKNKDIHIKSYLISRAKSGGMMNGAKLINVDEIDFV